jgi:hypothetical protein
MKVPEIVGVSGPTQQFCNLALEITTERNLIGVSRSTDSIPMPDGRTHLNLPRERDTLIEFLDYLQESLILKARLVLVPEATR